MTLLSLVRTCNSYEEISQEEVLLLNSYIVNHWANLRDRGVHTFLCDEWAARVMPWTEWEICNDTGMVFPSDQAIWIDDTVYWERHVRRSSGFVYARDRDGDMAWTYRSDAVYVEREDQWITEDLFSRYYMTCCDCGAATHEDDMRYNDDDGENYCPDCYEESTSRNQTIQNYSTDVLHCIPVRLEPARRYFGIELEQEFGDEDPEWCAEEAWTYVPTLKDVSIWKSDGSLNNGAELVSIPLSLDKWRMDDNPVKQLCEHKGWRAISRSHNTTTCGLHIHVSRASMTETTVAKLVVLFNEASAFDLLSLIARRKLSSAYCVSSKKLWHSSVNPRARDQREARYYSSTPTTRVPAWQMARPACLIEKRQYPQGGRYTPVNLPNNGKTIEFRIFRGSLKWTTVLASIEFCDAAISYASSHGPSKMTGPDFERWLRFSVTRNTYPALRDYLESRGILATRSKARAA